MTKADIIDNIYKSLHKEGVNKSNVEKIVNGVFAEICSFFERAVLDPKSKENKIVIVGFGTFSIKEKKETTANNPQTKEKFKVPAKRVPKITFSPNLKEKVNGIFIANTSKKSTATSKK